MSDACTLCPRRCGVDRSEAIGACGVSEEIRVSRAAPHMWEEPPISGTRGSGAIFFAGCNLRCVFCQNHVISHGGRGTPRSEEELARIMLDLQECGVHNIDLVTPTQYTDALVRVLTRVKPRLSIPIVWNSSGYESTETLRHLEGLVDIYLPDFKYASSELAARYSGAPDYPTVAEAALLEMYRQVGAYTCEDTGSWSHGIESHGIMTRGMVIRHLVLPGHRKDSMAVLSRIAALFPKEEIRVSIMRQYTPDFAMEQPYPNLHRRVTDFEYNSVLAHSETLGLLGFCQAKDSADRAFTPDF